MVVNEVSTRGDILPDSTDGDGTALERNIDHHTREDDRKTLPGRGS